MLELCKRCGKHYELVEDEEMADETWKLDWCEVNEELLKRLERHGSFLPKLTTDTNNVCPFCGAPEPSYLSEVYYCGICRNNW